MNEIMEDFILHYIEIEVIVIIISVLIYIFQKPNKSKKIMGENELPGCLIFIVIFILQFFIEPFVSFLNQSDGANLSYLHFFKARFDFMFFVYFPLNLLSSIIPYYIIKKILIYIDKDIKIT